MFTTDKNKFKRNIIRFSVFGLFFIAMCVLKQWYALPVFFGIGLLWTALEGKRGWCAAACPMGLMQDLAYDRKGPERPRKAGNARNIVRVLLFVVFWLYTLITVVLAFTQKVEPWAWFFRLMFFSMVTALFTQALFSRRYWCGSLCPLGPLLDQSARIRRRAY